MSFNYGKEKRKFEKQWAEKAAWYGSCGMDAAAIAEMHEYDWNWFCKERIYANRTQSLPKEFIDDDEESSLFLKYASLSVSFSEEDLLSRYSWMQAIDDCRLSKMLSRVPDGDKELLTLIVIYELSQEEIASLYGVSQQAISKQMSRIKKIFKNI